MKTAKTGIAVFAVAGIVAILSLTVLMVPKSTSATTELKQSHQHCTVDLGAGQAIGQAMISIGGGNDQVSDAVAPHNRLSCSWVRVGTRKVVISFCVRWEIRENPGGAGSSRVCVRRVRDTITVPKFGFRCRPVRHDHGGVVVWLLPSHELQPRIYTVLSRDINQTVETLLGRSSVRQFGSSLF